MARGRDTGYGSWVVFATLLVSSSMVLIVEWNKKCDGSLRIWLLVAICVTGVCGLLGALFHGRAEGTRPSRFLDDGDDEDEEMGQDNGYGPPQGMDLRPMDSAPVSKPPLPTLDEEGSSIDNGDRSVVSDAPDSCGTSATSRRGSIISIQLASRASVSLQQQYFGPGPKIFPDAIFLILVASQWFMAAWSVWGAVLYFRLFESARTCAPLLRHWTLLVVIMGFLSCILTVCYSGIMCCLMGSPFTKRRYGTDRDHFEGDVASNSDSSMTDKAGVPGMM